MSYFNRQPSSIQMWRNVYDQGYNLSAGCVLRYKFTANCEKYTFLAHTRKLYFNWMAVTRPLQDKLTRRHADKEDWSYLLNLAKLGET